MRDYAVLPLHELDLDPQEARRVGDRRVLDVQLWEWDADGARYDLRLYLTEEAADGACTTTVHRTRYYAVAIARLIELAREAGFRNVERRDGVLFQPVLVATTDAR